MVYCWNVSHAASTASKDNENATIQRIIRRTSPAREDRVSVWATSRVRTPRRPDRVSATRDATVIRPSPPNWISSRMITWPAPDQ